MKANPSLKVKQNNLVKDSSTMKPATATRKLSVSETSGHPNAKKCRPQSTIKDADTTGKKRKLKVQKPVREVEFVMPHAKRA